MLTRRHRPFRDAPPAGAWLRQPHGPDHGGDQEHVDREANRDHIVQQRLVEELPRKRDRAVPRHVQVRPEDQHHDDRQHHDEDLRRDRPPAGDRVARDDQHERQADIGDGLSVTSGDVRRLGKRREIRPAKPHQVRGDEEPEGVAAVDVADVRSEPDDSVEFVVDHGARHDRRHDSGSQNRPNRAHDALSRVGGKSKRHRKGKRAENYERKRKFTRGEEQRAHGECHQDDEPALTDALIDQAEHEVNPGRNGKDQHELEVTLHVSQDVGREAEDVASEEARGEVLRDVTAQEKGEERGEHRAWPASTGCKRRSDRTRE